MAKVTAGLHTFNRGRISKLGLARTDLDRTRLSAETQTNWVPRTLGSMMLRPGLEYLGAVNNSSTAIIIPFVFSSTKTALIELTNLKMQLWTDDVKLTRVNSTAAVTNGDFSSSALTGWTDADESGSTSYWVSTGYLGLVGTRYARAKRYQTITSSSGTHGIGITIDRGRVNLRVGSSVGGDDYFAEASLRPGNYSFLITSTGNFIIEFSANTVYTSRVDTVSIESSGNVSVTSPWASSDLSTLRWEQSADVIFVAAKDYQPRRIERYDANSWGCAKYEPEDGPWRTYDIANRRMNVSALSGDITLSCDRPFFSTNHIGSIFRITPPTQTVTVTVSTGDQWSDPVRVTGVDNSRDLGYIVTGTYVATISLQRSIGTTDSFASVSGQSYSTTVNFVYNDDLDNQIIYYRLGVASGNYTSGSPVCTLTYAGGGITGVARITGTTGSTTASASMLVPSGSTQQTEIWQEGAWSDFRGWPSAVTLHEGRLWWAGKSSIWGSVSDGYESFDPDTEGDSAPLNRSIASGGVERVQWLASLGRLIIGGETREIQAKTGSLEEPLTPTNFNLRDISSQGSANVPPVKIDKRLLFTQRGGVRAMEVGYSNETLDYETADRSLIIPEIGEPSISRMAVQRQPDTRLHCVRGATDGTVALLVSEPAENIVAWIDIESSGGVNGVIEDVAVLPGTVEDSVYYIVRREINGSTVRYLEKWAKESQARGGSSNRLADSFVVQNSTATTAVTGLGHLTGSSVIAWGATADLGSYTVSSTGTLTLTQAATTVVVGLPYSAVYKSAKLAYAAEQGTALTQKKRVDHVGVVMADVHAQGLRFGPSTATLDSLPLIEGGATISTDIVNAVYDQESIEFPGQWNTDSRIVLVASAPRPCTVLGAVISVETKEK